MKRSIRALICAFRQWEMRGFIIILTFGIALYSMNAVAQSGAGSIQGTVTDVTGAVIPGATIHVVNLATNVATDSKSNKVGFYQVPDLFAGKYTVKVTAPSMKSYKTTIQLLVAQAAVINPVMTAGAVTQQVQVMGNAVQLTTTDNGTITSTLENARINQLPLNGRVLESLLGMTTPGLEGSDAGGTNVRINGLPGASMEFVADGVSMLNRHSAGQNVYPALTPDPDAVQEVQAEITGSSAQYATPATVIITTKSGTNQVHGALFETARNNAIGIAKARQNPSNFSAPPYIRNEFGMSAGGPIVLPHVYHGKDKSFWFLSYERYSLSAKSTALFTVPTQKMREGDFSELYGLSNPVQLYDPNTTYNSGSAKCAATGAPNPYCRLPFGNNQIPVNRESPTMKMINDITPLPNLPYNPLIEPNLQGPDPNYTVIPTWTFRLDHIFNENNRAYLRYTSNLSVSHSLRNYPGKEPALGGADGFPVDATGASYNPNANFGTALGYTHVFSPSFFAETILSQQWESQHNFAGGTPLANFEKKLGLPNNFGEPGFPKFGVDGSKLINQIDGTQFIYGLSDIITNLDENLTKTIGRHQMQFGGRYRHERFGYLPDEIADENEFSSQATSIYNPATHTNYGGLPNYGNQNGDAFLGAGSYYSVNLELRYEHYHDMEFDGYFQDNYHMTRNLTWNLGLRYEAHPSMWVKDNAMTSFDLKNHAEVLASSVADQIARGLTTQALITNLENIGVKFETPQEAGLPSKMTRDYNLNFLPRVAFAYQPFGGKYGTVIRGAYGRYDFPQSVRTGYMFPMRNSPHSATYSQNYGLASQSPDGIQNYLIRNPLKVVNGVNSSNVVNSASVTAIQPGVGLYTVPNAMPPDFVTETNVTLEQPLKGNSVLRLSWLWTHGTNLDQEYFYNNHYSNYAWELLTGTLPPKGTTIGAPTYQATALGPYDQTVWGSMTLDQKTGWSNDNEFQANYQRLFHNGVAYQIFYVWSRPFRVGGNFIRDDQVYTGQDYVNAGRGSVTPLPNSSPIIAPAMPPSRPAGIASYAFWHQLDAYEDYIIDTSVPRHLVRFNGILNFPFGRGKRFLSGANRFVDEMVGGWQLAGDGLVTSQTFQVANGNWGPTNPIHVYKHSHKVTDCRSGSCIEAYQWFNGYIAPSQLPASGCNTVVNGLPSSYVPYAQPINTDYNPATTCGKAKDKYYNTNDVQVNLLDGTSDIQGFSPGPKSTNPWGKTFLEGPFNYTVDLSLFKVFPVTESTLLRINMDVFNALNVQGYNNPNSTNGIENMLSSHNTPRQVQLTARFQF